MAAMTATPPATRPEAAFFEPAPSEGGGPLDLVGPTGVAPVPVGRTPDEEAAPVPIGVTPVASDWTVLLPVAMGYGGMAVEER